MEKLYNADSYIKAFVGKVDSCVKDGEFFKVILDKTAFFPQQGGQTGDSGFIDEVEVFDTQIENGVVVHYTKTLLLEGKEYNCNLNWEQRFAKMQIHTAEHIFSGLAKKLYNCNNVGFHLDNTTTVDFDRILEEAQLKTLEYEVNKAIWSNKKVSILYPDANDLAKLDFRSKKEIFEEGARIVEIDHLDLCACCAPHVNSTGEIGVFKILSFMKHKGGTRIFITAGENAYFDYVSKTENAKEISNVLSLPVENIADGVKKMSDAFNQAKRTIYEKNNIIAENFVESLNFKEGNMVVLFEEMNNNAIINLVNRGKEKCSGMFVLCCYSKDTLRYVIGSNNIDLKEEAPKINAALDGKGGGQSSMIQGSFGSSFEQVKKYFNKGE